MSSILSGYMVMQQSDWAGRRFFTARDRRTEQVVYLVAEPVGGPLEPYRHPTLPLLEPLAREGNIHWLAGSLPEGETLEDLRPALTEADIISALLSVLDGLMSLTALEPPPVPSYLDPACIRRDKQGRWTLDYLALAHAPEARAKGQPPPGLHAFGVLLYWLFTGETVRRARVQIHKVGTALPSGLQFILIRCLGRSYPSLAELRADLVRASNEHEFRHVAQQAPAPVQVASPPSGPSPASTLGLERHRVSLGGPQIPMNDRPWALPERPAEGFRKFVVPPPPDPKAVRRARNVLYGAGSLAALLLVTVVTLKSGLLAALGLSLPAVSMPEVGRSGAEVGPELPPPPAPPGPPESPAPVVTPEPDPEPEPVPEPEPAPEPEPEPAPATPPQQQPKPNPQPSPQPTPQRPVQQPAPPPVTTPAREGRPALAPGTADFQDASDGGLPILIHVNGETVGWAYIIPHPTSPYISLPTFNRLFGRSLLWIPQDSNSIRLFDEKVSVVTIEYTLVKGRVWLRLTPPLQYALGVQANAYRETGMYFTSQP